MIRSAKLSAMSYLDSTEYEFGEDVGELRETARYLKSKATGLVSIGRRFKREYKRKQRCNRDPRCRRRNRTGPDRGKSFHDIHHELWLEYRFAISPLVRSMQDAIEAYNGTPKIKSLRRSARGKQEFLWEPKDEKVFTISNGGKRGFERRKLYRDLIRAYILYEIPNPVGSVRMYLGLRNKDIPVTLWQLFPYSFMVDRAADISSAIAGAVNLADPRLRILAGGVVERVTEEHHYTVNYILSADTASWPNPATISSPGNLRKWFTYRRTQWSPSVLDLVPPVDTGPLVEDITSIRDLMALFLSKVKPRRL